MNWRESLRSAFAVVWPEDMVSFGTLGGRVKLVPLRSLQFASGGLLFLEPSESSLLKAQLLFLFVLIKLKVPRDQSIHLNLVD